MRIRALALCAMLACVGCKSREPDYYTLSPVPGAKQHIGHLTLKLRRPAIDVTIDRPQIVRMDNANRITYDNAAQWSEPLDRMVERVLAQDLEERLPGSVAMTESGQLAANADYTVDLDIRQFGVDADGRTVLQAVSLVGSTGRDSKPHSMTLKGQQVASGKEAAQGLSVLLGQLADGIVADIRNPAKR